MISDLDETIKEVLIKEGGLNPSDIDISFEIPNSEWSARVSKPTINCYLFDIRENQNLKTQGWTREGIGTNGAGKRQPTLYFDLSYFLTAWTREVEDEHRLLWHALQTLVRFPVMPEEHFQGWLRDHPTQIYAAIGRPSAALQGIGEFWTALGNQIKPSLSLVTTVMLDRELLAAGPPVLSPQIRVLNTEAGPPPEELLGFAGTVRDELGAPVPGAVVSLEGTAVQGVADTQGRFRLRGRIVPGHYTLVARARDFVQRREIDIPARSYDITLDAQGAPEGQA